MVFCRPAYWRRRRGGGGGFCDYDGVHSGFDWLKIAENKFTQNDFTSFTSKFQNNHIASISGHFMRFILKIRQIVAGTNMIGQFHEFNQIYFLGVFLTFSPAVARRRLRWRRPTVSTIIRPYVRPTAWLTGELLFLNPPQHLSLPLWSLLASIFKQRSAKLLKNVVWQFLSQGQDRSHYTSAAILKIVFTFNSRWAARPPETASRDFGAGGQQRN